jgi:fumarate reductase subunit C
VTGGGRAEIFLFVAQRASAAVMAPLVIAHVATMIVAVRGGLTAAEILARTQSSWIWPAFYALFVIAAAIHAPIGLRTVLAESFGLRGRAVDMALAAFALLLLLLGFGAVGAIA